MQAGAVDRAYWIRKMTEMAEPVLGALARGRLRLDMPVEGGADRARYAHLEAFGRLLAGMAPWLGSNPADPDEEKLRLRYAELARAGLSAATDPGSLDFMNFSEGGQPIVDAAFLAHAIVRAPEELWEPLDSRTRAAVAAALRATRSRKPHFSNWLLFSAMIETALRVMGEEWDPMRIDYALRQHEQWYLGDGMYSDGPEYHADYYNSFVIQPMLVDIVERAADASEDWERLRGPIVGRARRYAAVLERSISPEGTFPVVGRSIVYRAGAFQALAQTALREELPAEASPAQVRCALTAVLRRVLEAPGTYDDAGWLTIGLCGRQPELAEPYISTGSLYLCATAFLPLGLGEEASFWSADPEPWTAAKAWSGAWTPIDGALYGRN
ncbi:DUF2264 domain-containing protein [Cohnella suwonensis]|uniref:DUF2264 domain-containing protein n=1 Tax=Cohnella suwonensis TaxID=696072 RepID=A0ABW0LS91_9BACL